MKKILFVGLIVFMVISCKSEQEKALDSALAKNDLTALRECYLIYGASFDEGLQAKYTAALECLIKDSTLFASVESAESVLTKYNAAQNYIKECPNGVHIEDVNTIINENKEKAEEIDRKLTEIKKAFAQYRFKSIFSSDGDKYEFLEPDESANGILKIQAASIPVKVTYWSGYRLGRVTRACEGTYFINDDLQVVITITEKRSYKSEGNYGTEKTQELIKDMKEEWPTPKPKKLILTYSTQYGSPVLEGKDQRGNEIYWESMVK